MKLIKNLKIFEMNLLINSKHFHLIYQYNVLFYIKTWKVNEGKYPILARMCR